MTTEGTSPAEQTLAEAFDLLAKSDLGAALAAFDNAERSGADSDECSAGRWKASMLLGEMDSAWQETDAIRSRGKADPHRFWDGTPIRGKRLMIRCLHGFGDTIQMIQFIPQVISLARSVILEVQPRLLPLLSETPFLHDDRLTLSTWGEEAAGAYLAWEVQVEIMELPYVLRVTRPQLPASVRYVQSAREGSQRTAAAMLPLGGPRIGLAWTAGKWNQARVIPFGYIGSLLDLPAQFWSLVEDKNLQAGQMTEGVGPRLRHLGKEIDSIVGLAAVLSNVDLVITSDTLAAHLAGAMGVPVWVLLPYAADWRWMQGETSPWYPTMRLFRQRAPDTWCDVVRHVRAALKTRLSEEIRDQVPFSAE